MFPPCRQLVYFQLRNGKEMTKGMLWERDLIKTLGMKVNKNTENALNVLFTFGSVEKVNCDSSFSRKR